MQDLIQNQVTFIGPATQRTHDLLLAIKLVQQTGHLGGHGRLESGGDIGSNPLAKLLPTIDHRSELLIVTGDIKRSIRSGSDPKVHLDGQVVRGHPDVELGPEDILKGNPDHGVHASDFAVVLEANAARDRIFRTNRLDEFANGLSYHREKTVNPGAPSPPSPRGETKYTYLVTLELVGWNNVCLVKISVADFDLDCSSLEDLQNLQERAMFHHSIDKRALPIVGVVIDIRGHTGQRVVGRVY
jgi:hypothetical protein